MRVALVNPPPYQVVDQYDTPDFTRLGLAYLAAQLRRDAPGCTVEIVDAKFERLSYAAVKARLRAFRPDLVGLTAFTNEINQAARVARDVKELSRDVVTVIGGVHVSTLPAETMLEFPELDVGVVGEGERTIVELVDALARGDGLDGIAGLAFLRDGRPVVTAERERIEDQDTIASPAWDLLPAAQRYLVMTQRGCPYRCTFCANPNGRVVRARSVESVVAEMREIADRFHPREILVCDEIFTIDGERTHRLLDAMIAADLGRRVRWWAQTHVNTVDRELFAKMKAAGCHMCGLGIETGDPEIMRRMRKGISIDRVVAAREAAASVGLPVESLMIIGHPHETWETAMRTIDFAVALNPDRPIFGVMVPYPGTHVAELARRGEGGYRLISTDWNDYNKQIGHAMEFERLSRRQLELLQMWAYLKVFLANGRHADLARFAWSYRSEGWAVVKKILRGRGPEAFDTRRSPYFANARADKRRMPVITA
ncbi:MAG TPA: radical SAM protein [Polyangiaceae bacterium]